MKERVLGFLAIFIAVAIVFFCLASGGFLGNYAVERTYYNDGDPFVSVRVYHNGSQILREFYKYPSDTARMEKEISERIEASRAGNKFGTKYKSELFR